MQDSVARVICFLFTRILKYKSRSPERLACVQTWIGCGLDVLEYKSRSPERLACVQTLGVLSIPGQRAVQVSSRPAPTVGPSGSAASAGQRGDLGALCFRPAARLYGVVALALYVGVNAEQHKRTKNKQRIVNPHECQWGGPQDLMGRASGPNGIGPRIQM